MRPHTLSNASSRMTFGILGAGNVGVGMAADIEHRGDRAILYATPEHDRVLKKIAAQGYIEATEALTGRYHPEVTQDLGYMIRSTHILVVTVPSAGHQEVFSLLRPYKRELHSKAVIFITGNGVAPLAAQALDLPNAFETSRAPYTVRIEEHDHGLTKVRINGFKVRNIIAGIRKPSQALRSDIDRLFGMKVVWYDNIAQVLFVDNHGLLHAPTMLRNQAAIREKRSLFFYRDCMTPAVCAEMQVADRELNAIARALGVEQKETLLETLNGDYGTKHTDLATFVVKIEALNKRRGLPASMQSRQITQDVQVLAVLWVSMARALGVPTPVLDSWIDESNEINGKDYRKTGRTLERYGLGAKATREEIRAALHVQDVYPLELTPRPATMPREVNKMHMEQTRPTLRAW